MGLLTKSQEIALYLYLSFIYIKLAVCKTISNTSYQGLFFHRSQHRINQCYIKHVDCRRSPKSYPSQEQISLLRVRKTNVKCNFFSRDPRIFAPCCFILLFSVFHIKIFWYNFVYSIFLIGNLSPVLDPFIIVWLFSQNVFGNTISTEQSLFYFQEV